MPKIARELFSRGHCEPYLYHSFDDGVGGELPDAVGVNPLLGVLHAFLYPKALLVDRKTSTP